MLRQYDPFQTSQFAKIQKAAGVVPRAGNALMTSLMGPQAPLGAPVGLHEDPSMVAGDEEAAETWGKLYHT